MPLPCRAENMRDEEYDAARETWRPPLRVRHPKFHPLQPVCSLNQPSRRRPSSCSTINFRIQTFSPRNVAASTSSIAALVTGLASLADTAFHSDGVSPFPTSIHALLNLLAEAVPLTRTTVLP